VSKEFSFLARQLKSLSRLIYLRELQKSESMLIGQDRYEQVHIVLARELERVRQRNLGGFYLISRQQKNSMAKPRGDSSRRTFVRSSNFFCHRLRRCCSFMVAKRGSANTDHHATKERSLLGPPRREEAMLLQSGSA
jgi:hypothetical protein